MDLLNIFAIFGLLFISFFTVLIKKNSNHAEQGHNRTNEIRKAYKNNGAFEIWQELKDKKTFHVIVLLNDGLYGDWIITRNSNGNIFEKSVFVPKDGSLDKIHIWLSGKATLYSGSL